MITKQQENVAVEHQTERRSHRSLKIWSGLFTGLAAVVLFYPTSAPAQTVPLQIQKPAFAQQAVGRGYYRLQLKSSGKYLDANKCSDQIGLNPGSNYANGACQLWKFAPAGNGYYRLQLKSSGKYLDANKCSDQIGLNPGSNYANGACQLWKLAPAPVRID
ncbi:MAG: RICIN domain-containing protein [Stenomitos frigidus ULC029]